MKKNWFKKVVSFGLVSTMVLLMSAMPLAENVARAALSSTPVADMPVTNGDVHSVVTSPDGNTVYIAGTFTTVGGSSRNRIAAINASTGAVTSWNPNANDTVRALAISSDGSTVYAGGDFSSIGGQNRNRIAALSSSGTGLATDWNPNASYSVRTIALKNGDDSTVYVGGGFSTIGGATRHYLAALSSSGTGLATDWNPNASSNVYSLVISGATVYAGGDFTSIGSQSRNHIAALDAITGLAVTDWDPNAGNMTTVTALALSGSTIYAGGDFSSIGGQNRNRIAALSSSGTGLATDWDPNANDNIFTLVVSGSTVYAGGYFTNIGGQDRNRIAALDASTGFATDWNPNADSTIKALAINSTTIYAGGYFANIGLEPHGYFAAFSGLGGGGDSSPPVPEFSTYIFILTLGATGLFLRKFVRSYAANEFSIT